MQVRGMEEGEVWKGRLTCERLEGGSGEGDRGRREGGGRTKIFSK
jgi:hypothetical protein